MSGSAWPYGLERVQMLMPCAFSCVEAELAPNAARSSARPPDLARRAVRRRGGRQRGRALTDAGASARATAGAARPRRFCRVLRGIRVRCLRGAQRAARDRTRCGARERAEFSASACRDWPMAQEDCRPCPPPEASRVVHAEFRRQPPKARKNWPPPRKSRSPSRALERGKSSLLNRL